MFLNLFAKFTTSSRTDHSGTKPEVENGLEETIKTTSAKDDSFKRDPNTGFAVLDVETTGLFPTRDRVIEIAIVTLNKDLETEDEYTTLINPARDLGPTSIHQITASMVEKAPSFEDVAGDILKRLKNRKIVGHNVQFDVSMLLGELARMNIDVQEPPRLCTLRLAYKLGPRKRRLVDCCEHFGIPFDKPHCALEDARATLELLKKYKALAKAKELHELHNLGCYLDGSFDNYPELETSNKIHTRLDAKDKTKPAYLSRLIQQLPEAGTADVAAYYAALDRVLEDRKVTLEEMEELKHLAQAADLSNSAVLEAHRDYLRGLVRIALADGLISVSERNDLECVTDLLGFEVDHLDELIDAVKSQPIEVLKSKPQGDDFIGKQVCFTGELTSKLNGELISRETALKIVEQKGMIAKNTVTKATDILVVADPDSLSGKAKKARQYGIRIMTDRAFFSYIGIAID